MRIAEVFPRAEILAAVPTADFMELDLADYDAFAKVEENTAITFGFAVWDHAMSSGAHGDVDPQMLAGPVNSGDPLLIRRVEEALKRPALFDFHHVAARRPGDAEQFAALSLAHLYPNHLHIGDVLLLDPAKPRTDSPWTDQTHESLRLFPLVFDRLKVAAAELGAEKLTLRAQLYPLWRGFKPTQLGSRHSIASYTKIEG
jgi:hypothetical protein